MTLPNIRWALLYGAVLCNARVIGAFGALGADTETAVQAIQSFNSDDSWEISKD